MPRDEPRHYRRFLIFRPSLRPERSNPPTSQGESLSFAMKAHSEGECLLFALKAHSEDERLSFAIKAHSAR